jgi:hypothetical protein
MGDGRAEFDGVYDIPLQIIAERHDIQEDLFGRILTID